MIYIQDIGYYEKNLIGTASGDSQANSEEKVSNGDNLILYGSEAKLSMSNNLDTESQQKFKDDDPSKRFDFFPSPMVSISNPTINIKGYVYTIHSRQYENMVNKYSENNALPISVDKLSLFGLTKGIKHIKGSGINEIFKNIGQHGLLVKVKNLQINPKLGDEENIYKYSMKCIIVGIADVEDYTT